MTTIGERTLPAPRRSLQPPRRVAGAIQAGLFVGLPFLRIGGESALRFDVPSLTLHVLGGSLAMDEAFVLLPATMAAVFGLLLVTVALGRVWCGWSCPQTVLGDLTRLVQPAPGRRRRPLRRAAGLALAAVVSGVAGAAAVWYFVPPLDFLGALARGALGPVAAGAWAVLGGVLFLDLVLLRGRFCATACPYARLQGVLFDRHTLVVAYDARRAADCVDCGACVRVCPTGIDIREGAQMECIACAECIDACQPIMRKLRRAPDLIGYAFGEPGRAARPVRPATVALAAATALSVAATAAAAVSAGRATLDLTVVPASGFEARRGPGGRSVEAFEVSLESRARAAVRVRLTAEVAGGDAAVRPAELALGPGEHRHLRVLVTAGGAPGRRAGRLEAIAVPDGGGRTVRVVSPITVTVSEPR